MRYTLKEATEMIAQKLFCTHDLKHGTKKIEGSAMIILTHDMITKSGLSGKKLLVYALIHNMCVNTQEHEFYGSCNYVATRVNCNIPNACKYLKELTEEGYIIKTGELTEEGVNYYTLPDKEFIKGEN